MLLYDSLYCVLANHTSFTILYFDKSAGKLHVINSLKPYWVARFSGLQLPNKFTESGTYVNRWSSYIRRVCTLTLVEVLQFLDILIEKKKIVSIGTVCLVKKTQLCFAFKIRYNHKLTAIDCNIVV